MKNKSLLRYLAVSALTATVIFQSCKKDDNNSTPAKQYTNGVFITNEGPFSGGTGTVSFWSRDNQTRANDIYNAANGIPLGNIVQSIELYNSKAYIVVNNANKIEVGDAKTLAHSGTISNLQLPRYFIGLNESKGYVTEYIDISGVQQGRVSVINLTTLQTIKTITVGVFPEKMALVGNNLFVVNSGDSTISIINTITDVVDNTITVGDMPNSIELDKNGNLWVLCSGQPSWAANPTSPKLVKFNPSTPNTQIAFDFATPGNNALHMIINNNRDNLYYIYNNGIYQFDISASALNTGPVISRSFYNIAIDPATNYLYGADVLDYTQPGRIIKYNTSFTAIDSLTTDVVPGNFYFVN